MENELQKLYDMVDTLINMEKQETILQEVDNNDEELEEGKEDTEEDEEPEYEEIEYKGKILILYDEKLYKKEGDIKKSKVYGFYINGKVVKNKADKVINV
jgi:hypothetical protein